ncbi:hypothetical protein KC362_g85 [Hortaea werneckii]|nr:hypothetical protein KC362_g85 [Hortaea werneckii]
MPQTGEAIQERPVTPARRPGLPHLSILHARHSHASHHHTTTTHHPLSLDYRAITGVVSSLSRRQLILNDSKRSVR